MRRPPPRATRTDTLCPYTTLFRSRVARRHASQNCMPSFYSGAMRIDTHYSFDNVIELLLDAVCVVDPDGRFVFVSAACERIFGYTPEEMLGRRSIDLVHPDDRESTLRVVDELHAGTDQFAFENRYVRKDGTTAHIMWSARWSKFDNFRVAVARDISERKRAQARKDAI